MTESEAPNSAILFALLCSWKLGVTLRTELGQTSAEEWEARGDKAIWETMASNLLSWFTVATEDSKFREAQQAQDAIAAEDLGLRIVSQ